MPESVDQCSKIQFALKKPETKRRIDYDEATVTKSVKRKKLSNMKILFLSRVFVGFVSVCRCNKTSR